MDVAPNLAQMAALIADPSRAAILIALMDGQSLPASQLASVANISPQTASHHLAKCLDLGILEVETFGRHRYYKLVNAEVAHCLEALSVIAPPVKPLKLSEEASRLQFARTCYDHLAGRLGVGITQALLDKNHLEEVPKNYQITPSGKAWFTELGLDLEAIRSKRRMFARPCLDWTERKYHMAGALAAALSNQLFELGWIARLPHKRGIRLTHAGQQQLEVHLDLRLENV